MVFLENFDLAQNKKNRYWHNFHLSTQISIYFTVLLVSMSALQACIYYSCWLVIWNIFTDSSKMMLIKDNLALTDDILDSYVMNANHVLLQGSLDLYQAERLFHLMLSQPIQLYDSQPCLIPSVTCDSYAQTNSYCHGWFAPNITSPQNTLDVQAMKFDSLLNIILQMIDPSTAIYFSTTSQSLFFSNFPSMKYSNYNPHQRSWYANNSVSMQIYPNDTFFSDPYLARITGTYFIAHQKALTNLSYDYNGVFASAINFKLFNFFQSSFNNMSISIMDRYGKLLLVSDDSNGTNYIYNKSITGFNRQDYLLIKNMTFNQPYESTCVNHYILSTGQLCLYNTLLQSDFIITTRLLPQSKFIILLIYDPQYGEILVNQQTESIFATLLHFYQTDIIIFVCSVLGITIGTVMIVVYLLQTISKIEQWTVSKIYQNSQFKNLQRHSTDTWISVLKSSNLIKLEHSFQNLKKTITNHQNSKSLICIELEEIQLPKNENNRLKRLELFHFQNLCLNYHLDQIKFDLDNCLNASQDESFEIHYFEELYDQFEAN